MATCSAEPCCLEPRLPLSPPQGRSTKLREQGDGGEIEESVNPTLSLCYGIDADFNSPIHHFYCSTKDECGLILPLSKPAFIDMQAFSPSCKTNTPFGVQDTASKHSG